MDLHQLEMLLAVAECGGYSSAGRNLHVSHSAVHRQIRLLEHEIHERAFARTGKHVELTEAGQILAKLARRIRQDISEIQRQLADLAQLHSGHLRIGTGTTMLIFFLRQILRRFRKEYAGVEIYVMTDTADRIIKEVAGGNLDIGIVNDPMDAPQQDCSLQCEVLYRDEFVFAAGLEHPLSRRKTVSLSDLVEFPFITSSRTSHSRRMIERVFERAGLTPKVSMELENEEAMEKMIEINMGVGFLSKRRAVKGKIHYFRIPGQPLYCEVGMVFAQRDYIPRAAREFARLCREARTLQRQNDKPSPCTVL